MTTQSLDASTLIGRKVFASDGEKLGKVDDILTDGSGHPQYLEIKTGWFGGKRHAVPVDRIDTSGGEINVPYDRAELESAPTHEEGELVDYDRERALAAHYGHEVPRWRDSDALAGEDLSRGPTPRTRHPEGGLDDLEDTTQGPTPETRRAVRSTKADPAAPGQPAADRATRGRTDAGQDRGSLRGAADRSDGAGPAGGRDEAMTRSEEELSIERRRRPAGRVRLRKWVETEMVTTTVPVERERARIEREPITDANIDRAMAGPELTESEHEIVLSEEEVDVSKRTVPKERVRLEKDAEMDERTVRADVRRERIEMEGDGSSGA
jgi:uncharacterized protein (TIGR02271 family)